MGGYVGSVSAVGQDDYSGCWKDGEGPSGHVYKVAGGRHIRGWRLAADMPIGRSVAVARTQRLAWDGFGYGGRQWRGLQWVCGRCGSSVWVGGWLRDRRRTACVGRDRPSLLEHVWRLARTLTQ